MNTPFTGAPKLVKMSHKVVFACRANQTIYNFQLAITLKSIWNTHQSILLYYYCEGSCFLGQVCGFAKMHLIYIHAASMCSSVSGGVGVSPQYHKTSCHSRASSVTATINLSEKLRRIVFFVSIHSSWVYLSSPTVWPDHFNCSQLQF